MVDDNKLLEKISKLENELNELKKSIKTKQENPYVDIKKIKVDERYYFKQGTGVGNISFSGFNSDKIIIDNYNAFTDKNYASKIDKEELLSRKLDKFAWDNDNHVSEEDWEDKNITKYSIYFDCEDERFGVTHHFYCRNLGQVYFKSREVAEKAIEIFKEELLEYFKGRR